MALIRQTQEAAHIEKLLLIPGMDGTGILFEEFKTTAPQNVEVYPVALPPDDKFSYVEYAEYVEDFIKNNGLYGTRITIVAESFGGAIAYELIKREKVRVKRLVLVASFLSNPSWLSRFSVLLPIKLVQNHKLPTWLMRKVLFGAQVSEKLISQFQLAIKTVSTETLKHRLKLLSSLQIPAEKITVPVTYIQPMNDYLISSQAAQTIANISPDFTHQRVKGGHFILQSNPAACWQIIADLLSNGIVHLNYHFEETVKLMIILSSQASIQQRACAFINPEEDLANDLFFHFVEHSQDFVKHSYLSEETAQEILEIDTLFDTYSSEKHLNFWTGIETDPRWEELRHKAKEILIKLELDDLQIEINNAINGTTLQTTYTQIKLVGSNVKQRLSRMA